MKISLLKVFILWIVAIALLAIAGPLYMGCGSNTATTEETVEEISDAEGDIFDEGPVGIPAPIARVEGTDQDNTDIVLSGDDSFEITGRAGAVPRPGVTPFVWICNNNEDVVSSRTTACTEMEVASDGSFGPVTIVSRFISIYTATGSLSDSGAMISPPLTITLDDDGNIIFTLVNIGGNRGVRANVALVRDADENVYFVVLDDDTGTYHIFGRNTQGGFPPVFVAVDSHSEPIPYLTVTDNGVIVFLDEAAGLYRVNRTEDEDGNFTFSTPELIETLSLEGTAPGDNVDFDDDIVAETSGNRFQLLSYSNDDVNLVFLRGRDNTFDAFWLKVYDVSSATTDSVILEARSEERNPFEIDIGDQNLLINYSSSVGTGAARITNLSAVSNLTDLQTTYNNSTQVLTTTFSFNNMTVMGELLAFTEEQVSGVGITRIFYTADFLGATGFLTDTIQTYGPRMTGHPTGNFVLLCFDTDGNIVGNDESNKILQYYLKEDATFTLFNLLQGGDVCSTKEEVLFDNSNSLVFFSGAVGEDRQISLIKLEDTALSDLLE